ncbi:hypothetical protein [Deinococcus sp.]|uniref:hypothetical protein n=1 Tax=Deinococcus sp. TaxID=47478 RepID=UPI003CC615CF
MSSADDLKEFGEYAQTRTVTGTQAIGSLSELRDLIVQHGAWGWTLAEFQQRAGVRIEGDTAYVTRYDWGQNGSTLDERWELVQYIHTFYAAR